MITEFEFEANGAPRRFCLDGDIARIHTLTSPTVWRIEGAATSCAVVNAGIVALMLEITRLRIELSANWQHDELCREDNSESMSIDGVITPDECSCGLKAAMGEK